MEPNGKMDHPQDCKCGMCCRRGKWRTFFVFRMIIAILLAIVIFWAGFMLGELHTIIRYDFQGYGSQHMMSGGWGTGHMQG